MPRHTRLRLRPRLLAVVLVLSIALLLWPGPLIGVLRPFVQLVVPLQHSMRTLEASPSAGREALSGPQAEALALELAGARREAAALAVKLQALEAENEVLTGLRRRGLDGVLLPALVVAHDSAAYRASGLLDRGRLVGIWRHQQVLSRSVDIETAEAGPMAPNMSVLSREVLIGEIVEATPYTARVLLVTDPASRLRLVRTARQTPAGIAVGEFELMLYGAGNGRMEVRDIEYRRVEDGQVQLLDQVVTDGGDARLPASIHVGRIVELRRDDDNPALYTAVVEPAFTPQDLKKVYVVSLQPAGAAPDLQP
jgi:cell shape-determining protein MreC